MQKILTQIRCNLKKRVDKIRLLNIDMSSTHCASLDVIFAKAFSAPVEVLPGFHHLLIERTMYTK
jgi:hypothetical protein